MNILDLFQGIGTMFVQSPSIVIARIVLIFLGFLLVYLGSKGTLEPLIMVPMGLGMSAVNAGVSCVPSMAKVAQKAVSKENPAIIILDYALGANICGVITTAILTGIYITLLG